MGVVIIISNYLVQFPVNKFNLQEILTYGAFSYPITFLITDLANRRFGKEKARKLVYFGFVVGVLLTLFVSTNFKDIISIRIAIGSGTAFLVAQLVDVEIFQRLRNNSWFVAPVTSSVFGSAIDTFLFFSISFLGTSVPWVTLAFGDLLIKLLMAFLMLIPFRLLILKISDLNIKTNI
jgi:queuosine precursor transporter